MTQPLIIGANCQIGRHLISLLAKQATPCRAMVRNPAQQDALEALGAEVVVGDLEGEFNHALDGCNAVIFTAGSGGHTGADKTLLIDLWGAIKSINASTSAGIKRYIMVSSRHADNPDNGRPAIRHYLVAKHAADNYLMDSPLDYTILRPGRLTNAPATDRIQTSRPSDEDQQTISREDVARAIQYCLDHPHTCGQTYELYEGPAPINEALSSQV